MEQYKVNFKSTPRHTPAVVFALKLILGKMEIFG